MSTHRRKKWTLRIITMLNAQTAHTNTAQTLHTKSQRSFTASEYQEAVEQQLRFSQNKILN